MVRSTMTELCMAIMKIKTYTTFQTLFSKKKISFYPNWLTRIIKIGLSEWNLEIILQLTQKVMDLTSVWALIVQKKRKVDIKVIKFKILKKKIVKLIKKRIG